MKSVRRHFVANLLCDLKRIWACRQLIFKPLLFTLLLLALTFFLKRIAPWAFMDLGNKDEAFGSMVFVALSLLHGMLLTSVFSTIREQNDKINLSLRNKELQLFKDNYFRRVPVQIKLLIFCLSILIVYSVASCDLGSDKKNMIAVGITLFVIILAWVIAYEMDDPFSGIWNIRSRVPKKWWEEISGEIEGSPESGKIRLKDIFLDEEDALGIADGLMCDQSHTDNSADYSPDFDDDL